MGTCERLCLQTLHAEIIETVLSVVRGMLTCTQAELKYNDNGYVSTTNLIITLRV